MKKDVHVKSVTARQKRIENITTIQKLKQAVAFKRHTDMTHVSPLFSFLVNGFSEFQISSSFMGNTGIQLQPIRLKVDPNT